MNRQPQRWPSFLVSLSLHGLLVLALTSLTDYAVEVAKQRPLPEAYQVRFLSIQVPDALYLSPSYPRSPAAPAPAAGQHRAAAPWTGPEDANGDDDAGEIHPDAAKPISPPLRPFELAKAVRTTNVDLALLQPEAPPQLKLQAQISLPTVLFWSAPKPVAPPLKPFVLPGRTQKVAEPPVLDAPPKLERPNLEPNVAEMKLSGALLSLQPVLLRPPATSMPVRIFQPPARKPLQQSVAIDSSVGDPITVLSFTPRPAPMPGMLIVSAVNRLGPPPERPSGPEANGRAPDSGASGPGAAALPSSVPIRTVHPNNSTYDVVVQSVSSEIFPETSGALTGRPIYTVYLPVGALKHWILQYCVPAEAAESQASNGYLVQLGNPAPIQAPYPLVSLRPIVRLPDGREHMVVQGWIDVSGRFRNLTVLRGAAGRQADVLVLESLEQWEFRPATRDGRPILVEMILAIPGDQA